jgi:multicomponent Na+:H+ antiporter subunit A
MEKTLLMPPFIPILILALGALVLSLLSAVPRMRGLCIVAVGVAGLAMVALLRLGTLLPVGGVISSWRPLALFGAPLTFEADAGNWSLATVLAATSFLSLCACCASADRPAAANMALILAATGAGVAALFATSFVALVVAWGTTDVLLAAALLRYGPRGARRAALALFSGILATSALWAAPLLTPAEGASGFLDLAHFAGRSVSMLQIAVILRLGLVPLHLWRPIDLETEPSQLIPLVVIPTLLGFDLLTFLPALTAGLPSTLFALAAVTVLVGGFVAWSETEEPLSMAGVVVAETGMAVLAVANAGQQAVATAVAAAIVWALGVTVFSLTPGWSGRLFWRGLPSLLALLSLIGLPATLGFVTRFTAYNGLEADLLALVVALLGETFVVAAMIRLWFWAELRPLPGRRYLEPVYLAIFMSAAVALLLTGLSPDAFTGRGQDAALPSLDEFVRQGGAAGWAGWALPLVAGVALFLTGEGLRQRLEGGWQGLGALLRLEWVYGLFYLAISQIARLMRGISGVVEGEGALLWTAVILLIILLYLTSNGGGPFG